MLTEIIHQRVAAVAPIFGVSIGDFNNKTTWSIGFKPEATTQQRIAAQSVLDQFDVAAEQIKLARIASRQQAAKAEAALATQFRTLTPTQAVNYIETNVTNLATAKDILKIMARILIATRDQIWPDMPE